MVTTLSSMGCRRTSRTLWPNSGSSSKKSTPRWLSEISPGLGMRPPPTRPACEIVWWGARKGREVTSGVSLGSMPATLYTFVVSSASSGVSGGMMEGSARARSVLPLPGGPTISRL